MSGPVNHPEHYNQIPGIECIDVAECFGFNIGNVIKYAWRAGLKDPDDPITDLQKAVWYAQREIERITKERAAKNLDLAVLTATKKYDRLLLSRERENK